MHKCKPRRVALTHCHADSCRHFYLSVSHKLHIHGGISSLGKLDGVARNRHYTIILSNMYKYTEMKCLASIVNV